MTDLAKMSIALATGAASAMAASAMAYLLTRRPTRINKLQDIPGAPKPLAKYVNAVAATIHGSATLLQISGQLGCDASGTFGDSAEAQCNLAFSNVHANLRAAGMDWCDLMKVTVFLSNRAHLAGYRRARDRALGDTLVGSSLVICDLVAEHILVEIEAVAVK